tara:strand:+ start:277 stop:1140 length:864 start_codon:yes stop_codon:yes gene_type:complete
MSKQINLKTLGNLISIIRLKDEWKIDELIDNANIKYDDLIYFLNVLSEIYSKNGEYFFDFDLDTINNKISFNNSNEFHNLETITDLELFKIYTLLNTIDINMSFQNITKKDLTIFNKTLKDIFNLYDLEENIDNQNKKIMLNQKTMIEYIKLGNNKSHIYEIEPLLITSNKDGSVLEAIDINDKKVKTFIINRIININDKLNISTNLKKKNTEIEVAFNLIDNNLLKKLNNYKHKKNKNSYLATFRNKDIAIEFFIENFHTAKVISPDIVKVGVMKRINSIKKLLTQ